MMEYDEEAGDFVITKEPILKFSDNSHELLVVACEKCSVSDIQSRGQLHESGWTALGEECHFCPECSKKKILWGEITD